MNEKLPAFAEHNLPAIINPDINPVAVGVDKARKISVCEKLGLPADSTNEEIDREIRARLINVFNDLDDFNNQLNKIKDDLDIFKRPLRLLGRIATFFSFKK